MQKLANKAFDIVSDKRVKRFLTASLERQFNEAKTKVKSMKRPNENRFCVAIDAQC